jgi:hypothetical protein
MFRAGRGPRPKVEEVPKGKTEGLVAEGFFPLTLFGKGLQRRNEIYFPVWDFGSGVCFGFCIIWILDLP